VANCEEAYGRRQDKQSRPLRPPQCLLDAADSFVGRAVLVADGDQRAAFEPAFDFAAGGDDRTMAAAAEKIADLAECGPRATV
jgi:hypothetical protein